MNRLINEYRNKDSFDFIANRGQIAHRLGMGAVMAEDFANAFVSVGEAVRDD